MNQGEEYLKKSFITEPISNQDVTLIQNYDELHVVAETVDEYVEVEEKYCGPFTCCIGSILFFLFWPATAFMGCCLVDKRVVKKKVVRR